MPHTFYIGIKGLITLGNKVLLMKKKDHAGNFVWDIPGGRIEKGEDIEQALIREIQEEVPSIRDFTVGEFLFFHTMKQTPNDDHGLFLIFYTLQAEHFQASVGPEHSEFKWFTLQELEFLKNSEVDIDEGHIRAAQMALKA